MSRAGARATFSRDRQILALIVAVGLALASAHLAAAPISGYYATAVRSMSESWHAWFFGALDPASTITIDKVPGWLQIQALCVRVLGFHGWVIELPQVLAEGVSIIALYAAVRRWRGVPAARIAAILFVLTPIVTPTFAHSMADGPLACCLILALDRAHRATVTGRLRSLVASALWIAAGFEMKMGEAWLLLPVIIAIYCAYAPIRRRTRALHVTVAATVSVAASLIWIVVVALVGSGSRPYLDGTTNDNPFTMAFGYNGLERLGIHLSGSMPQALQFADPVFVPGRGWDKLVAGHLLPQIGWMLLLAVIGLVWGWRRTRGVERAGYLLWGAALGVFSLVLSAADLLPHAAYVVVLSAPTAALAAAFLVELPLMPRGLIALVVVTQAVWSAWVWAVEPSFAVWLRWGSVAVAIAVVAWLLRKPAPGVVLIGSLAAAMVAGPITWTVSTLNPAYAGSDLEATAGPPGPPLAGVPTPLQAAEFGAAGADFVHPGATLTGDAAQIWELAEAARGSARFPLTTVGWYLAQPFILATGAAVLPTGGYSRLASSPSPTRFQAMVRSGDIRIVLLGVGSLRGALQDGTANNDIVRWVVANCALIKASAYPAGSASAGAGLELLDCGSSPLTLPRDSRQ